VLQKEKSQGESKENAGKRVTKTPVKEDENHGRVGNRRGSGKSGTKNYAKREKKGTASKRKAGGRKGTAKGGTPLAKGRKVRDKKKGGKEKY